MNEKSLIDVFQLCWDVIRKESSTYNVGGTYFNSEHCKVLEYDTPDTNFDILENRLAYTYKYGCYNILFFEKCFLNFLNESSDFDTFIPLNKLNVCSLSNGPGFDIIGLLFALCKSNKTLTPFPVLNAVNRSVSWSTLYKTLICEAYEILSLKFPKCIPSVKDKNINVIQGDIFSKLAKKPKKYISDCNVLLMVKVFFSTKCEKKIFWESLRQIFLCLRPGALVFFIGSKKNMCNFTKYSFLSNYVKTIYGPRNVMLDNIMIDENICQAVGQKPVVSGIAEFIVWQKREASDMQALIEDSKKNKKNKDSKDTKKICVPSNINTVNESLLDESIVDDDCPHSNDSESVLSYSSSTSKLSETSSVPPMLSQSDSICSVDDITSILGKTDLDLVYNGKRQYKTDSLLQKPFQLCSDSTSDATNQPLEEGSTVSGIFAVNSQSALINKTNSQILENSIQENKCNLCLKCVASTSTDTTFPSSIQCKLNEKVSEISSIKETKENVMQFMNKTTNQQGEINIKNDTEMSFQKNVSLSEDFCRKLMQEEENVTALPTPNIQKSSENIQEMGLPSLNSLIQQCENLVATLEDLALSVRSNIGSSKSYSHCKKHFCQTYKSCEVARHCCCCVKIVHVCCCQKKCNC